MTILHIVPSYKPAFVYGGPIYSVSALCEAQAIMGNEIVVFTTNANGANNLDVTLAKIQRINNVSVVYFPRITGDHTHVSPKLWLALYRDAKKYDVVHLHSWWSILMIGCAWILWLKGVRFILSPRGMFSGYSFNNNVNPIKKKIFFNWLSKPVLKKQVFHATALSEEKEIKGLFSIDTSVFTLPNLLTFPNLSVDSIQKYYTQNGIHLLFISRVDRKKGIEILLEAVQKLKLLQIPVQATIIGSGSIDYHKELENLAHSLDIIENLIWKGSVEWNAKFMDILAADILVLPSFNENFANIILETLYAGRPVIVSKYVGLCDYVSTHNMGWVIDTNPDEIVVSVKDYINNKKEWQSKALQIHNQVKLDFNSEKLAESYINHYKQSLNIS